MTAEVIVPTWDRVGDLRRALASLRAQTVPVQLCVVDNGSSDGTAEMVAASYPEARVIRLESNLGFGRAVNAGIRSSDAEAIVLMNNDGVADPDFVRELLDARSASGAPMVAGCMISEERRVESAGVIADQSLIAYDHLHGIPYDSPQISAATAPLGPSGGAALYDRRAMMRAGLFDENIFAYLEDLDLALRMRLEGADCVLAARAHVVHRHSATLGSGSQAKNRLLARNRRYLVWKYGRSISLAARMRGLAIDVAVSAGRIAFDRNAGAIAGWLEAARAYPRSTRPPARAGLQDLPLEQIGIADALRLRLLRRRRLT